MVYTNECKFYFIFIGPLKPRKIKEVSGANVMITNDPLDMSRLYFGDKQGNVSEVHSDNLAHRALAKIDGKVQLLAFDNSTDHLYATNNSNCIFKIDTE